MSKCRCDSKPCAGGCPCSKAGSHCTPSCHMGKAWDSVPCLNTETGLRVKSLKPVDVRQALCSVGLSPIGDKNELLKRLAVHYTNNTDTNSKKEGKEGDSVNDDGDNTKGELINTILSNEGEYVFILCLSGKIVSSSSSKADLRRAYLVVSSKVHPDKNPGNNLATKAFQAVVESFERLANPDSQEEEDDDDAPARKRPKTEKFTRDNKGCSATALKCPKCRQVWNTRDLGLEDAAYNFMMLGIKQYICGGCFAKFGCMTALHVCPHCRKSFEYDPDDYHRKISCGSDKCSKSKATIGFMMFKVSDKREAEVRKEVKIENEQLAKKRAQEKRRAARLDKRAGPELTDDERVQESLFVLKLVDNCPRCGWELERGMKVEDAKAHLEGCTDQKEIEAHRASMAKKKAKEGKKKSAEETQEDVMALKTWEHNGRQVGQLWMLGVNMLKKQCVKFDLDQEGSKVDLITRLGRVIRDRERKMLTMGDETGRLAHDVTPIHKVDDEDLPDNMESLDREDLQCVAASYGLDFDHKSDVKMDLVKKLEKARSTGRGLMMITDDRDGDGTVGEENSDSDYEPTDD